MTDVQRLTDDELVAAIGELSRRERAATAGLVAHLAEMEARGLHLALGFTSLYGYCRGVLKLSEHESYNRMEAARAARRFPAVLQMLADGRLHLTAVRLLAPHLTPSNHAALLDEAVHKSKAEVLESLARRFPSARAERRRATIEPLSGDVYDLRVPARRATIERLRRAQELLSHAVPDGDVDEVLYRALGALIEQEGRKRPGALPRARRADARLSEGRPDSAAVRAAKGGAGDPSRYVTADVERRVRERDGNACGFAGRDGRRCGERRFLEMHHRRPWITGSPPTVENLGLRCRAHNQYEWKVWVAPIRRAMEAPSFRNESGRSEDASPA